MFIAKPQYTRVVRWLRFSASRRKPGRGIWLSRLGHRQRSVAVGLRRLGDRREEGYSLLATSAPRHVRSGTAVVHGTSAPAALAYPYVSSIDASLSVPGTGCCLYIDYASLERSFGFEATYLLLESWTAGS